MQSRRVRSLVIAYVAFWALIAAVPVQGAMKVAAATIPIPTGEKATMLAGLSYGSGWLAEINSIRVERDTTAGADPLRVGVDGAGAHLLDALLDDAR